MNTIPTNIITGFLGAGKTTAILSLLKNKPQNEKWAVLINEFGQIGIDGAILSQGDAIVKEVAGGCMCCISNVPMSVGINALLAQKPDRILIEPTGLGHPKTILKTLMSAPFDQYLALQATLALVDPQHLNDSRYTENENFQDQLNLADVIIANKIDLCHESDLQRFESFSRQFDPAKQAIGQVKNGELDPIWLSLPSSQRSAQHEHSHSSHHQHDALPGFELTPDQTFLRRENHGQGRVSCGWVFAASQKFDFSSLFKLFANINAERIKAVVNTDKGAYVFNAVNRVISVNELSIDLMESKIEIIDTQPLPWDELEGYLLNLVQTDAPMA